MIFFSPNKNAFSQNGSGMTLSGWAWSDNIGWVSLNCNDPGTNGCLASDYKVSVDNEGNLSGWAWSDNIGWVKFNSSGPYPEAPAYSAKISDGELKGWARACSATALGDCASASRGDGWDGWIKLSGANYGLTIDPVTLKLNGFAWGSDVVGWLSFKGETYDSSLNISLLCDFKADPGNLQIVKPATSRPVTLFWDCNAGNASPDSVVIDNGIGAVETTGSKTLNLSESAAFNLTATKFGISRVFSVTVSVGYLDINIKEIKPE